MKGSTLLFSGLSLAAVSAAGIGSLYLFKENEQKTTSTLISSENSVKQGDFSESSLNQKNLSTSEQELQNFELEIPHYPISAELITGNGTNRSWQVDENVKDEDICTNWGGSWNKRYMEDKIEEYVCYRWLLKGINK